jgi:hypothetical protein
VTAAGRCTFTRSMRFRQNDCIESCLREAATVVSCITQGITLKTRLGAERFAPAGYDRYDSADLQNAKRFQTSHLRYMENWWLLARHHFRRGTRKGVPPEDGRPGSVDRLSARIVGGFGVAEGRLSRRGGGGGLIRKRAKRAIYCVAKNATHRAARPDPSRRKERLLRMTNMVWTGRTACIIIFAWHSPFESAPCVRKSSS